MSKKRTLHSFFNASTTTVSPSTSPSSKRSRIDSAAPAQHYHDSIPVTGNPPSHSQPPSIHPTYPFPIAALPLELADLLNFIPATDPRVINDKPDLDLLYYEPYISRDAARQLFDYLRSSLPFYRVCYKIKRGSFETEINTPRFTTVFGVDDSSLFAHDTTDGSTALVDGTTKKPVSKDRYKCSPRPLPSSLEHLRRLTEAATGCKFNFCLVNYYASGTDSISYHSDDERFLGANPAIASLSLGARRDFLLRHKPPVPNNANTDTILASAIAEAAAKPLKFPLGSGDMVLMRGPTQSNWLHSIPKRTGKGEAEKGRINITFRRALVRGGTENYYQYNVGTGGVYRWDEVEREMKPWDGAVQKETS